jgi:hypothetical protein
MIFAALSVVVGTVFGLTQNCSNKPPSSATHSEASTGPSITPLQQTEAHEPRQTPAISPEQPPTEPITTSTPEETPEESPEQPLEEQPEESPTPSS